MNPPDYTDGLGGRVRKLRLQLRLSQRELAERLDMRERSLSDIERGRRACPPGFIDQLEALLADDWGVGN